MVRYKAKLFRSKYKISSKSSLEHVKMVVHKLGYNLLTFTEGIMKLSALNLQNKAKTSPAITTIEENGNITIYYNDELPINIQRFSLAHELGHIVLGHFFKKTIGKKEELEANKFAEYLFESKKGNCFNIINTCCLLLCVCLSIALTYKVFTDNNVDISQQETSEKESTSSKKSVISVIPENTTCYYTEFGEVYHLYTDCQYLKNAKYVYTGTVDTCEMERLCSACEKRKSNYNK